MVKESMVKERMVNSAVDNRVIDTVEWIVLSKAPVPGLVKTRLIPALGQQGACDLYLQLLDRLENTLKPLVVKNKTQVALWIAGDAEHDAFKSWSSFATFYQQPETRPDLLESEIEKLLYPIIHLSPPLASKLQIQLHIRQ